MIICIGDGMGTKIELPTEVTRQPGYVEGASGRTRICGRGVAECSLYDGPGCPCRDVKEYQRGLIHDL